MSLDDIKEGLDDAEQKAEWLRKRIEVTGPEYDEDRDGQLFPVVLTTPAQAFYNRAIFPGWQKWNPTFRHGTITAITDGLADITLESVQSSAQNLEINQESTLSGVPFEYMNCDHLAFSVGDVALIMFSDQMFSNPKVIGFKEEPRGCGPWPAIVVYDSPGGDQVGVVICGGGGFEPPYTFIPRASALPADSEDDHKGELPGQRIWDGWQDTEPSGEHRAYEVFESGLPYELEYSSSLVGWPNNGCVRLETLLSGEKPYYDWGMSKTWSVRRKASRLDAYVFCYTEGASWPSYDYEGGTYRPGKMPGDTLAYTDNDHVYSEYEVGHGKKHIGYSHTLASVVGHTLEGVITHLKDNVGDSPSELETDPAAYDERETFYTGNQTDMEYYWDIDQRKSNYLNASVVDENRFGICYNVKDYQYRYSRTLKTNVPHLSLNCGGNIETNEDETESVSYGPTKIVMDGELHTIDTGNREWVYTCAKYFDLDSRLGKSGETACLFCTGDLDDLSIPFWFVFAHNKDGKVVFTETQIDVMSPLPGVVDTSGDDVSDSLYIDTFAFFYAKELRLITTEE